MSETVEQDVTNPAGGDVANEEDIQRTLRELRREHADTQRDLASERTRRQTLEATLTTEQIARTTAEADRDTHAARVATEAESRWNAEKGQTTTAITSAEQTLSTAEEDYARHAELGEWKEAAKAQRVMAEQTSSLVSLRQKQDWLENNKEKLIPKPAPRQEQQRRPAEAPRATNHRYANHIDGELATGEEAWLDARPQFQTDQNYRADVFAASNMAARRHTRGSDSYFREIEKILGETPARAEEDGGTPPAPTPRPAVRQNQSADLPASRRAAPGETPAAGRGEVRLSADEVEVADGLYGDPNSDWYIADSGERYKHYDTMKKRKNGRS